MTPFFKRAMAITDVHFGKRGDSEMHNQDCLDFIAWMCSRVREYQPDILIVMGDWYDNRTRMSHLTAHYSKRAVDLLAATGLPIMWIVGNHDLYYRDNRSVHSLEFLSVYPTIHIVNDLTVVDRVVFCPWLVGDEYSQLVDLDVDYIFGHFELPSFLFNQMIEMPDKGGLHGDFFRHGKGIFSGHFHKRQCKVNANGVPIWYMGNAFPHDFNDVHDNDRGLMILDYDHEPKFETWPDQPTFHRIRVGDLVELMESGGISDRFNDKAIIECHNDAGLDDQTMNELRSIMGDLVRDFRVVNFNTTITVTSKSESEDIDMYSDPDDMVLDAIANLDTQGRFDPNLLAECFKESII